MGTAISVVNVQLFTFPLMSVCTLMSTAIVFVIACCSLSSAAGYWTVDLGSASHNWRASSQSGADSYGQIDIAVDAIPSDVYLDAYKANRTADPYLDDNDVQLRWIGDRNWTYSTIFQISDQQYQAGSIHLRAEGLDTVVSVLINGHLVLQGDSMFIEYTSVNLKPFIQIGSNSISIQLISPTHEANVRSKRYSEEFGYEIPPSLQTTWQHGMANVNFIRKTQSSFSWDWGPGFATMGIWKSLSLIGVNGCYPIRSSAVPLLSDDKSHWIVNAKLTMWCDSSSLSISVSQRLPELGTKISWTYVSQSSGINVATSTLNVSAGLVSLWWPAGYGNQSLYTFEATITNPNSEMLSAPSIKIGFRRVELVEEVVLGNETIYGRTFYFKINDVDIFIKGTNWIPNDSFLSRVDPDRIRFLFYSMSIANMNCLLIWGGGNYENDEFYSLADKYGILIWHSMMFAVSLYPADAPFLNRVRLEIVQQVTRLQHHPSIFVWSGNVENELGLRQNWFHGSATFARYKADYMQLYNETVWGAVNGTDYFSRPYLLSSPSDGIRSIRNGGVADNPASEMYGDVHYYNYIGNAWLASTYPIPRCASEYGFQSLPTRETLDTAHIGGTADWSYFGGELFHRQHHAAGNLEMLVQVLAHFKVPSCLAADYLAQLNTTKTYSPNIDNIICSGRSVEISERSFLDSMIYFTQAHQAYAYKVQTEHYRRWKSGFDEKGRGRTMCALYWQLNDIWQAPSWASIDYNLKWKMAHYYAKKFFEPIIVSATIEDDDHMKVYVVSDKMESLVDGYQVLIELMSFSAGYKPIYSIRVPVDKIDGLTSKLVYSSAMDVLLGRLITVANDGFLYRLSLLRVADGQMIASENVILPDRLFEVDPKLFGKASLGAVVSAGGSGLFIVQVHCTGGIAPFVWLNSANIRGHFDDNGFTMTRQQVNVTFHSWYTNITADQFAQSLSVISLRDWYI